MRRPHINVATVLVDPAVLRDLELDLAALDLWVWPIATTPNCPDGPRMAFQVRRRLVEAKQGAWGEHPDRALYDLVYNMTSPTSARRSRPCSSASTTSAPGPPAPLF